MRPALLHIAGAPLAQYTDHVPDKAYAAATTYS